MDADHISGPYSPAVLRFQISFPDSYPRLPPLVTFSTDMFHPMITPLTTYMYTTDIQDNGTVSATDDERLPPGGFSLRHGFSEWFGRGGKSTQGSRQTSGQQAASSTSDPHASNAASPASAPRELPNYMQTNKAHVSTYDILKYIRSAFDSEEVLDAVPLDAAGNPGAWHAWRTHRRKLGKLPEDRPAIDDGQPQEASKIQTQEVVPERASTPSNAAVRRPGEWNWDGVWEDRVKKGVAASLSEASLYGGSGLPDDLVRTASFVCG